MHIYAVTLKTDDPVRLNNIESVSACIQECKKVSECKAFTYATKNADSGIAKACWLKLGNVVAEAQPEANPTVFSGMIDCTKHPDMPANAIRYDGPQI